MTASWYVILGSTTGSAWSTGGFSWWQAAGGVLVVFALLGVTMRFLGRWTHGAQDGRASLLAVIPLGHRRDLQVLRLKDEVHYIYRQEGALLLLGKESFADYQATAPQQDSAAGKPWRRLIGRTAAAAWRQASHPEVPAAPASPPEETPA
jgi:hypothetical protein